MAKSPDAFRTISEVADWLETQAHVLRFWESKFPQVKPVKRAGGRRYYRPADMLLLGGIKHLLHDEGMTIKGAQKLLREQGIKHVSGLSQPLEDEGDVVISAKAVPAEPAEQVVSETATETVETVAPPVEIETRQPAAPDPAVAESAETMDEGPPDTVDEDEEELPSPETLPAFLQRASFDTSDIDEEDDEEDGAEVVTDAAPPEPAPAEPVAAGVAPEAEAEPTDAEVDDLTSDLSDDTASDHPSGPLDSILSALVKRRTIPAEHRDAAQEALARLEVLSARLNESAEG